ncbi:hypothetical protein [Pseudomonas sp. 18058]|uniref:hypothetical protein n=1 Tax=Pseudomonas sp. 18058 TaxID=2681406 RepID=UPI00135B6429|nr:hypothetical protein [Pseudomonas sp. 18058]
MATKNTFGDDKLLIHDIITKKNRSITFDWQCNNNKRHWAQQLLLQTSCVVGNDRKGPILVKSATQFWNTTQLLKKLCERWEISNPHKPLWNWSRHEIIELLRLLMQRNQNKNGEIPFYSYSVFSNFTSLLSLSNSAKALGKINDGCSFPITTKIKREAAESLLTYHGITYGEWMRGESYPAVPFCIASFMLSRSIDIIESTKTQIAECIFETWRSNYPIDINSWFSRDGNHDIVGRFHTSQNDYYGLNSLLKSRNLFISCLPWKNSKEFMSWCDKVIDAASIICFTQTGHRYSELISARSTDQGTNPTNGTALLYENLDKSYGGIRVPRPIPKLTKKAVDIAWNLSFFDSTNQPLCVIHRTNRVNISQDLIGGSPIQDKYLTNGYGFDHITLIARINRYYKEEVLDLVPEAKTVHPKITFHQFRHSFAEFALRRFDEDVRENIREHFVQTSYTSTDIYLRNKLNEEVRSIAEKNYLYEIIGKIAEGVLDEKFWGPAYIRLKNEINKIQFLTLEEAEKQYLGLIDTIERIVAFEWGYCVYFKNSKREARCRDPQTGIPQIEGGACAERCTGCPNNMGNTIQKDNLIRCSILHSEIAANHEIKALAKISENMASQISKRIGV